MGGISVWRIAWQLTIDVGLLAEDGKDELANPMKRKISRQNQCIC
jgi:hypothetical protein